MLVISLDKSTSFKYQPHDFPSSLISGRMNVKKPSNVVYYDNPHDQPDETYLIPIILFHDGIETYNHSLNPSVYVISAMIMGSLVYRPRRIMTRGWLFRYS